MPTVTVRTMFELARIVGRPAVQLTVGPDACVRGVLQALVAAHAELQGRILDPRTGDLLSYLFVELNGRDVRALQGLQTPVHDGDALAVMLPVAGGR